MIIHIPYTMIWKDCNNYNHYPCYTMKYTILPTHYILILHRITSISSHDQVLSFISHSSYFGVTSHHPRWPNVLFQQGTSEWQPVKKTGKGWERYRKVPRCCVFVGFVTGLLLKIPDVYYIILCIYTLWLLATSTFVKLLKGHCSRQILVSIWISKNPFLLHVVWTQKCIQVRIGPFSLCKSCT